MSDETKNETENDAEARREEAGKKTFTVKSANPDYSGEFAGVTFVDGEGVARGDNYAALLYFQNHPNYEVTAGGDLPDEEDESDLDRTSRLEQIDRTSARDAVREPDEAVSWGDRRSAKDYVDDTPATNGFGVDGEGIPVGARTPVGSLKGDSTTHGEVKDGPSDPEKKPAARRTASKPSTDSKQSVETK